MYQLEWGNFKKSILSVKLVPLVLALFLLLDMTYLATTSAVSLVLGTFIFVNLFKNGKISFSFDKSDLPLYLIFLLFLIAFINTKLIGPVLLFDIIKVANYFIFSFILSVLLQDKAHNKIALRYFENFVITFSVICSFLAILSMATSFTSSATLRSDYNLFALMILSGAILYSDRKFLYKYSKMSYTIKIFCISIMGLTVLLSSSRRTTYIMITYCLLYLIKKLILSIKEMDIKSLKRVSISLLLTIFFIANISFMFHKKLSDTAPRLFSIQSKLHNPKLPHRVVRLRFAKDIISKFSTYEMLLGKNFNYIDQFRKRFNAPKGDYPHNSFVSQFLFSGIIGTTLLFFLLCNAFTQMLKLGFLKTKYFLVILSYFASSQVSGNTIFTTPLIIPCVIIVLVLTKNLNKEKSSTG